jgi:putative heme-binding domain-containing protein
LEKVADQAAVHVDRLNATQALFDLAITFGNSPVIRPLRAEYLVDGRNAGNSGNFSGIAEVGNDDEQELAYAAMINIAANPNSPKPAVSDSQMSIERAWESPRVANLLRAVGETHATNYLEQVRAQEQNTAPAVAALATELFQKLQPSAQNHPGPGAANFISKMTYEEASQQATAMTGDPQRGAQLFDKLGCIKCHTTAQGQPLKGPFLGDITTRYKPPEIVESILRTSAKIAQGFTTTTVETADGTDYEGFVVRESGDTLELRNLAGPLVIPKKDIVKRGTTKLSVMPEGLFDQSTPSDLASMLAYLKSLAPK